MMVTLQLAACAVLMLVLGFLIRWVQLRLRLSYLAGRAAASVAGIVLLPLILPMLGAKSTNDVRVYAVGGAFGYASYWLAVKLWPTVVRIGGRRRH